MKSNGRQLADYLRSALLCTSPTVFTFANSLALLRGKCGTCRVVSLRRYLTVWEKWGNWNNGKRTESLQSCKACSVVPHISDMHISKTITDSKPISERNHDGHIHVHAV